MDTVTVKYRIERAQPRKRPTLAKAASETSAPRKRPRLPPDRTARLLALAHNLERLIENGEIEDYAAAAKRFGLSRARVTQIANLLSLSPTLQENILMQRMTLAERSLRPIVSEIEWAEQERLAKVQ